MITNVYVHVINLQILYLLTPAFRYICIILTDILYGDAVFYAISTARNYQNNMKVGDIYSGGLLFYSMNFGYSMTYNSGDIDKFLTKNCIKISPRVEQTVPFYLNKHSPAVHVHTG